MVWASNSDATDDLLLDAYKLFIDGITHLDTNADNVTVFSMQ